MFFRNLGRAAAAVTDPVLKQGINVVVVRNSAQLVAYIGAFAWLTVKSRKL
jgi:hypothetical protein